MAARPDRWRPRRQVPRQAHHEATVSPVVLRRCGRVGFADALAAMRAFTDARGAHTPDEWWLLEHPPVYTLGLSGRREHLHAPGAIAVEPSDRGGQVTYHGPGQMVCYVLMDLTRAGLGVRALVGALEQAVLALLTDARVHGQRRDGAPGVYVDGRKLASLGLRVRRGRCYHGLALNVDMDLEPFGRIDPCGYAGLEMTQLRALIDPPPDVVAAGAAFVTHLARILGVAIAPWDRPGRGTF